MIRPGNIVLATAGKEKGKIFVVVGTDQSFAYLADGGRLLAGKPKRKSFKHVKFVDDGLEQEQVCKIQETLNAKIRKILKAKRSDLCQKTM